MLVKFPSGFLWGSSISSYQVEGDNTCSDWFFWEKKKRFAPASEACRHYSLYPEDFDFAVRLGHNALRFSLEWARVCPQADTFCEEEIAHYLDVVKNLKDKNLTPILTLHHFTNPIWFFKRDGWLDARAVEHFIFYLTKIGEVFKDYVKYWIIFNEPLVYIYNGFLRGIWPPGYRSVTKARIVLKNILKAYLLGYKELKRIYGDKECKVSVAKHMRIFSACPHYNAGQNFIFAYLRSKIFNYSPIECLLRQRALDFLGLNYYCKDYVKTGFNIFGKECKTSHHEERRNTLGWNIYPQGLYEILAKLKSYQIPVIITENGTSERKEALYEDFLTEHIKATAKALYEGTDVIGYMWWSLLDNFEWDKGFSHRFGLLKTDFDSFKREPRSFAFVYKQICENNAINI